MVRPNLIMQALHELADTTLYKSENVQINDAWLQLLEEEQQDKTISKSMSLDSDS